MINPTINWTIKDAGLGFSIFSDTGTFLAWYYTKAECESFIKRHASRLTYKES